MPDASCLDIKQTQGLDRSECLRLVASRSVGRLGLTIGALPTVIPVNYRLIGERLYFRIGDDEKLRAATTCAVVAFQVDDIDESEHGGWSVVLTGIAEPIEHADIQERLESIGIPDWLPAARHAIVGLATDVVAGCRFNPNAI